LESSPESSKSTDSTRFKPGNKLAKGGKRPGAGRKSKQYEEDQRTAREIYRAEQQRQAKAVIDTYYRLAKSGRYPQATLHEIDKIDPDDKVNAPTLVINFVAFNSGSVTGNHTDDVSTGNNTIDVSPLPSHAPIVAPSIVSSSIPSSPATDPSSSTLTPRLTFTDIRRSR
jgi:hypothetical protein